MSAHQPQDSMVEERAARIVRDLRARGHRITPQRVAIIRDFIAREDHPSAEDVYRRLIADYPMIALSTVYNTLSLLAEVGEAVKVSPATPEIRFDPDVGDHCHLTCLACSRILDVPMEACAHAEEFIAAVRDQGFEPARQVLQVFGYCAECRQAREPDRRPS